FLTLTRPTGVASHLLRRALACARTRSAHTPIRVHTQAQALARAGSRVRARAIELGGNPGPDGGSGELAYPLPKWIKILRIGYRLLHPSPCWQGEWCEAADGAGGHLF